MFVDTTLRINSVRQSMFITVTTNNSMNGSSNPHSLAEVAAGWYFSNLDPHNSNEANVHRYLRTPVVALTVKILRQPKPPPLKVDALENADFAEEKVSMSNVDWREYLKQDVDGKGSMTNDEEQKLLQEQYASLSRRTKARMEAFLAGCSLAVPGPNDGEEHKSSSNGESEASIISLQDGLSGFGIGESPPTRAGRTPWNTRTPSLTEKMGRTVMGQIPDPNFANHPQIAQADLIVRLELFIRTIQRARNLNEECVIAMEPPKSIRVRARCITYAFVATAAYVRNISPVLTRLLCILTMEMLAVECVADEIKKVIRRIVSEYEHGTSFASLAFLSTPEVNADSLLMPLILKYLEYLQSDWERLVRECELERMLARAVDPELRRMFKTIEFRSIGHLLEVCHGLRDKLQNIELAPNVCAVAENINTLCNNPEAIRQALRDLRREVITVNGHVLPPVTSRKQLISLLTQALNSGTLTSIPPKKKRSSGHKKKTTQAPGLTRQNETDFSSDTQSSPEKQNQCPLSMLPSSAEGVSDLSENDLGFDSSSVIDSSPDASNKKQRRRRSRFHLSTIDVLTRRLLIAASRTGNGGDAYFFV